MSVNPLQRIEGKYEILGKLKEGGMGTLYKVRHRLLDEVRVVKLMRPHLTENTDSKARFVREARFAIKLRHPNVAQLYDFTVDEEDGTAFIVMEFIDGLTFEEILATKGPPPLGLTLEMAQQSLRALGYLHGQGLIHRDVSPDNLILTRGADGEPLVKLIDLGIAKTLEAGENLTRTGTFLGKVRYASPEQFGAGGAQIDGRGDLYSFGIVLYELLIGRSPIQGSDTSSLIAAHLFRPPLDFAETDPKGRVPPCLRQIVLRGLAKSPAERFATADDFSRALGALRTPADLDGVDLRQLLCRPRAPSPARRAPAAASGRQRERSDLRTAETHVLPAAPAPAPPDADTDVEATRRRSPWAFANVAGIASIAAGLLLALGLGSWLLLPQPAAAPAPAASPAVAKKPTPAAAVAAGTLVLDAAPWGEVVEIVDREGRRQPLGAQRFTPLALSLPPGHYRATLRNPNLPHPVQIDAEVLSGSAVKSVAELGGIDEEEFFHGLGW